MSKNDNISEQIKGKATKNSLDVSNTDYLVFQSENIKIEVIGGIKDAVLSTLRVTLKIYKVGTISPLEIYRSSQVDLFNENQTSYLIQKVSERLKIESNRFKAILYDCIEELEDYRKGNVEEEKTPISKDLQSDAKTILQSENLIENLEKLLKDAGITDTKLGLQIFIAGISRITKRPIHTILLGSQLLGNKLVQEIIPTIPKEDLREVTTMSKYALSYPPTADYWENKTLILHQLESIKEKNNTLLEYILQGQSKRLVTGTNTKTGQYQSFQKEITETINLLSYTAEDYHPVFNGKQSICLPIKNINKLRDKLYIKEVTTLAGLIDEAEQEKAQGLLRQIQREIKFKKIENHIIEEVDLFKFFGKDIKELSKYLQLVNLITLLHQHQTKNQENETLEVKAEYMLLGLEMYQELWLKKDDELYYNVRGTFTRIKKYLKKAHKEEHQNQTFKLKEVRKALFKSPVTMQRHLSKLEEFGKVERIGGNNRIGFDYRVIEWQEAENKAQILQEMKNKLKNGTF